MVLQKRMVELAEQIEAAAQLLVRLIVEVQVMYVAVQAEKPERIGELSGSTLKAAAATDPVAAGLAATLLLEWDVVYLLLVAVAPVANLLQEAVATRLQVQAVPIALGLPLLEESKWSIR